MMSRRVRIKIITKRMQRSGVMMTRGLTDFLARVGVAVVSRPREEGAIRGTLGVTLRNTLLGAPTLEVGFGGCGDDAGGSSLFGCVCGGSGFEGEGAEFEGDGAGFEGDSVGFKGDGAGVGDAGWEDSCGGVV